jgi:predicted HTH transcriptional regulator
MQVPFLSLHDVTAMHADEIREAALRVIDSGWYLQGKENERFEQHYADYIRIINRLTSDLPVPFKLVNNERDDDTPLHETVREALLNALVHADYYGRMGTVIIKSPETLSFANPGDMRISLAMALARSALTI